MRQAEPIDTWFGKALARCPDLALAEIYVPAPGRRRFRAFSALLAELEASAFECSDPAPAVGKCRWWAEELAGMQQGRARHPIGRALVDADLPWRELGEQWLTLVEEDASTADRDQALARLRPLARVVAELDAGLVGCSIQEPMVDVWALHWLAGRLRHGRGSDAGRIALQCLARHGLRPAQWDTVQAGPMRREWAGQLAEVLSPAPPGSPLLGAVIAAANRRWLQAYAAGRGESRADRWLAPLRCWRVARDAALHYGQMPASTT